MSVRRGTTRLVMVTGLVAGILGIVAAPATAASDSVRVRSASTFTVGGSPGTISVGVTKRTSGCVLVRTTLGLRLSGAQPDQVRVQVMTGGRWWPVAVSSVGEGALVTTPTAPTNPTLCKGKSVSVRYRVWFLAGAPSGRLSVAAEAITATNRTIARDGTSARVVGGQAAAATASPKPTPTASETATEKEAAPSATVAAANPQADGGGMGIGALVMIFGVLMVAIGGALLWFLMKRSGQVFGGKAATPSIQASGRTGTTYGTYESTGTTYGSTYPPAGEQYRPTYGTAQTRGTSYGAGGGGSYGAGSGAPADGGDSTTVMPRFPG